MLRVKWLGINTEGRDFVVGDIHGEFDLVLRAMDMARFDPAVDRLLSVGDLIDRGSGSHRCARFLAQAYVHAVRGNHEDTLIALYDAEEPPPETLAVMAMRNGFGWWLSATDEQRTDVLAAIRKLPIAIEVETERGTVGLVHADVPSGMSWQEFTAALERGDKGVEEIALWGRVRIKG